MKYSFVVADYALHDTLKALSQSEEVTLTVTKEDNNLVVIVGHRPKGEIRTKQTIPDINIKPLVNQGSSVALDSAGGE